jgi:polygalacturonase
MKKTNHSKSMSIFHGTTGLLLIMGIVFFTGNVSAQSYNILDLGAKNDGKTVSTEAFNKAIKECSQSGGGVVIVPPGTYQSGTIYLKDNVELRIEMGATISASTDHTDFPRLPQPAYRSQKDPGGWFALIYAEGVKNIAITGEGTINGNGADQQPRLELLGGDRDGRPRNILFISCKRVKVEGVKMLNSGIWNQHYLDCEDVLVDKIHVYNHSNRNNDAIDIDGCRRFVLSNSILDSDDDGITLKNTGAHATEDVTITNCIVSSFCNAIKAGTESTGGFRNITISNCIVKPSRSTAAPIFNTPAKGITAISLEIVDGGIMEGVTISNITIEGTKCPLYIRLGNRARKHIDEAPEPPAGVIRNISINNVAAYNTGNFSNSITAIPGYYVENISISNFQCFNTGGLKEGEYIDSHCGVVEDEKGYPQPTVWGNLPSSLFFIRHARNITIDNVMFGSNAVDPRIPIIAVDVENLRISRSTYTGPHQTESFALFDRVSVYDIEKPLGWTGDKIINKVCN